MRKKAQGFIESINKTSGQIACIGGQLRNKRIFIAEIKNDLNDAFRQYQFFIKFRFPFHLPYGVYHCVLRSALRYVGLGFQEFIFSGS